MIRLQKACNLIRDIFVLPKIPLHIPYFDDDDHRSVSEVMKSTFVSSVGPEVNKFEKELALFLDCKNVILTNTGTAALHVSLLAAGCVSGDLVITQAISFVATSNAIKYCNADPIFIDISPHTLGMCPKSLRNFLTKKTTVTDKGVIHKDTGRRISCVLPMHTFGNACDITEIVSISKEFGLMVVEDAAEALGSKSNEKALGTFGDMGTISFNGNKLITTGGGGAVLCKSKEHAKKIRHISTTAKVNNKYYHDEIGYNYRMPNLNAALGLSQLKKVNQLIVKKRELHLKYKEVFADLGLKVLSECSGTKSNYWLNTVIFNNELEAERFIKVSNNCGIMTRPVWYLLPDLPHFKNSPTYNLSVATSLSKKCVSLPSWVEL